MIASAGVIILQPAPDLSSSALGVSYTASTGAFTATGTVDSLTALVSGNPTLFPLGSAAFTLTATIDNTGAAGSGTLAVDGCVDGVPGVVDCSSSSGVLLSGTLDSFSFEAFADGEMDFGFSALGGDLLPIYGSQAYMKLNMSGFPGDFGSDFSTDGYPDFDLSSFADVGVAQSATPEPANIVMVGLGLAAFWLVRRKLVVA